MVFERLARAAEDCRRQGHRSGLLFIDHDNFKTHPGLLVEVEKRLIQSARAQDIVRRIGGDEFVGLLEKIGSEDASATARTITVANQLLAALQTGFAVGCVHHRVSAGTRVVVFGGRKERPEILRCADIAMYQARAAGRDVALHNQAATEGPGGLEKTLSPVWKISRTTPKRLMA